MFLTALSVNFDLIIILILLAMLLIGYISGATIELIKLIRVIIPFLVVFYFGGPLARIIFKNRSFKKLVSNVSFLQDIPYFNTIVMLTATIIAFFGAYFILGLIINQIQKAIQTEIVNYKLGKFNKSFGSFLAGIRFYILASVLILPFYMLSVTSKEEDVTTKLIMENPPAFTRVGMIVNSSEPVIDASNSLTSFIEVVDLGQLKEYYNMITDINGTIEVHEQRIMDKYNQLELEGADLNIDESDPMNILSAFSQNPDQFINAANDPQLKEELEDLKVKVVPYRGLIMWADEHELEQLSTDEIVNEFTTDYDTIIDNTEDEEMKTKLKNARQFIIIKNWLDNELQIDTSNLNNLLNDENIEIILEQLVIEYDTQDKSGLIFDLKQLKNPDLNEKLIKIEVFVANYQNTYKDIMKELKTDMPFKYKLIAATMNDVNFIDSLERSPVMAMYVLDTVSFLNESGLFQFGDDNLYQTIVKIIIPLYLVEKDDQGNVITIDETKMKTILEGIDYYIDQVVLTKEFANQLVEGLVTTNYYNEQTDTTETYLQYLIETDQFTKEALISIRNHHLFKDNEKITSQLDIILSEVGDLNV